MSKLIVQKYGGSSVAHPEQIKNIAKRVSASYKKGQNFIIVVSAMGKTTDQLVELAHQVSPLPSRRELDMLLSTGERISMALLTMALHDQAVPAISFTGSQAGVLTDGSHSNAQILDLKPIRVTDELAKKQVVVLAGFQGVNPLTKEITTLGRGGSDTTAVAMAAHFKADKLEILKDVEGVFSTDPKLVASAKVYQKLSYDHLLEMCFWGAKVLHYRSVELAKKMKVPLYVGSSEDPTKGTLIVEDVMFESGKVLGVNSHKEVLAITVKEKSTAEAFAKVSKVLEKNTLAWPQVIHSYTAPDIVRLLITAPSEALTALHQAVQKETSMSFDALKWSSVSVTCAGAVGSQFVEQMLSLLFKNQIEVVKFISGPMTATFFVAPEKREHAIQLLHGLA
jgi:aspartate kinase